MHFSLIFVSEKPNHWVDEACQTYVKRLPASFGFNQTKIQPVKRTKNTHIETARDQEWQLINEKISKQSLLILLDERGKHYSSKTFATQVGQWQQEGQDVTFVIAGADGVNEKHRQQANGLMSLSELTLPHEMARLLLVEQLYRAWSILTNHPYHRV